MKLILIFLSLFVTSYVQADVYKYINKQGKTAYSDKPIQGSEKIVVPPVMTYQAPAIPKTNGPVVADEKTPKIERVPYQILEIISPVAEGTVRSNQGIVKVSYTLTPSLQKGDELVLFVDGKEQLGLTLAGV